ncbi:NAD(P)/FAD-dependent oxidoreductase [Cystobacter ferrugineus]|uniref:Monooxygenase n=1 Tax=Cystobacter ferrugineus TaxID=83449 RepID=A0A1L9BD62_9BACT|nr:NAD(P)/FAD-dependent oxidoreductase [Cystobacter ferrugineus]OJH40191.1 monooxygenase [Cystobacter ferrugineus]
MTKTDVAIVGGGPAGLAVAIHAARRGISTLLFERQGLPRDKACGEGLMPAGLRELEALGARAHLTPADCAPIVGIRYLQEDGTSVEGRLPPPGGLGIRRLALQTALERVARGVGVEIREHAQVTAVDRTSERVRLTTAAGERVEARLLVAADGLASPLRRDQGLDVETRSSAPKRYGLRQHFRMKPWTPFVEVHFAQGVEAYVTPAGDERVGVAFLWQDGGMEGRIGFAELVRHFPALQARLVGAPADSSPRGAGPLERGVRARSLDRFVLVGDAAGYVDAITGEGLTLAFRSAAELGRHLPEVLAKGASRASLTGYEQAVRVPYLRYVFFTRLLLTLARRPGLRARVIRQFARVPFLFEWMLNQVIEP